MGPGGMHPWVWKELADVAKALANIIESHGKQERFLMPEGRPVQLPSSKGQGGPRKQPARQPPSIPGEVVEQVVLEHVEEKKIIRSSQHGFTRGKSCLTSQTAFCDGMAGWVNGEQCMVSTSALARV
ncbi:RNA-directed DNA polymerase from mobile element jockey-like protein [Turdus rufiventris]|nr:RNA-directed DNA polymerase from mobile element jockey-like protein [Turdus rufiventris]